MNLSIFNFLFSFSANHTIAVLSLFVSNVLIYILLLIIVVFVFIKIRPLLLNLFVLGGAGIGAYIVSKIIKEILKIPRPFVDLNITPLFYESGYSLPSSHATLFAALTVVALSLNRKLGIFFIFCTFAIGISRSIIGVHYPSDVVFGFIIGALIGTLFVRIGKSQKVVAFFTQKL